VFLVVDFEFADRSVGKYSAAPKINAGNMMAVSFASIAAKQAVVEAAIHRLEGCELLVRALRDFFSTARSEGAFASTYLRKKSSAPKIPIDISGSGTVTHATDSVCAGCSANKAAASNTAARSRNNFHTSQASSTATATCFVMLSRCHPQGESSLSMKLIRSQRIKIGR
jgi:hypothetical protein